MKDFKQKTLKYLLILGTVYILINLAGYFTAFYLRDIGQLLSIDDTQKVVALTRVIPRILVGIVFGIILFSDCRKEIKNQYIIPFLGVIDPVVGTILYFIEKLALSKIQKDEIQA